MDAIRSLLFCPANRPDMVAKTPRSAPDAIAIDLEDAVPPGAKEQARGAAIAGAAGLVAAGARGLRLLRVNGVDTPWHGADLALLAEPVWDGVIVPKAERADGLRAVRAQLDALGRPEVAVVAGLESMSGTANARDLAPLADAVYFGAEDFIADIGGVRTEGNAEVLYARSAVVLAARLAGTAALDQVTVDLHDGARFEREAQQARALGYTGKLCIHPGQVGLANAAFSPAPADIDRARRLVAAFDAAGGNARGVIDFEGQMVDLPLYRQARAILDRAAARA